MNAVRYGAVAESLESTSSSTVKDEAEGDEREEEYEAIVSMGL